MRPLLATLVCVAISGCSSLGGDDYAVFDPHEDANRAVYDFVDYVDRHTLTPVARGYQKITPGWLENGISNIFQNLRTLPSAINGYLQGKPAAGTTKSSRTHTTLELLGSMVTTPME